jgi:beta-phosphoglucomutase-like phosphatase (HAD superfamily)
MRDSVDSRAGSGVTRAVAFDFNGTLSHDEPILFDVYREMFFERGRPVSVEDYYGNLAGLSEDAIIGRWLGVEGEELAQLVEERIERYLAVARDGSTVSGTIREAVAYAASRVPVALVSGAFRREIEPVLVAAGLDRHITAVVAADDVGVGKPDPAGYLRAVELLGPGLRPHEVIAFEDTEAGVAAAKAAGLYCVAVLGTHPEERLREADERVSSLDEEQLFRLLG